LAFALSPDDRIFAWARWACFWDSGLFFPFIRRDRVRGALISLVGRGDQPGGGQFVMDATSPGGLLVVHGAAQYPGHPQEIPVRTGDDLQIHAVLGMILAGEEGPVRCDPVYRDEGAVQDCERVRLPGLTVMITTTAAGFFVC
jgi:hypothetical protein